MKPEIAIDMLKCATFAKMVEEMAKLMSDCESLAVEMLIRINCDKNAPLLAQYGTKDIVVGGEIYSKDAIVL